MTFIVEMFIMQIKHTHLNVSTLHHGNWAACRQVKQVHSKHSLTLTPSSSIIDILKCLRVT